MKKQRKIILTVLALALCLTVSIGITIAYFNDYEDASGGATLNLNGQTKLKEGIAGTSKNIVIQNTGDANMVTRVMIFDNNYMDVSMENAEDWKAIRHDEDGYTCYYYKKVLKAGSETSAIKADLNAKYKGDQKPNFDFDVTVIHESALAIYDGDKLVTPKGWDNISEVIDAAPLPGKGE